MARSKAQPPIVADNGPNDIQIHFYVSDASSGNKPRVRVDFLQSGVVVGSADHAISEYTTVTGPQKAALLTILTAIRDETLTLEGFV